MMQSTATTSTARQGAGGGDLREDGVAGGGREVGETKSDMEKADKRMNTFRFEADVLLTGLMEWDKLMKMDARG